MKNTTCFLHGLNLRPELCNECARCERLLPSKKLKITDAERGALVRVLDRSGRISFRAVRPIEQPAPSWHRDAWHNAA